MRTSNQGQGREIEATETKTKYSSVRAGEGHSKRTTRSQLNKFSWQLRGGSAKRINVKRCPPVLQRVSQLQHDVSLACTAGLLYCVVVLPLCVTKATVTPQVRHALPFRLCFSRPSESVAPDLALSLCTISRSVQHLKLDPVPKLLYGRQRGGVDHPPASIPPGMIMQCSLRTPRLSAQLFLVPRISCSAQAGPWRASSREYRTTAPLE